MGSEQLDYSKLTTCKGLFWRGSASSFLSSHNSIEERKSLRLLKKKSCAGCPKCEWFWEVIQEEISMENDDYISNIEHGKLYTFKINSYQGYYDSYPEIESIEFVEVIEVNKND